MYLYGIEIWANALKYQCSYVLIVPLWNWNSSRRPSANWSMCSNCTFMELKYVEHRGSQGEASVLIVPLWNWNSALRDYQSRPAAVLIVPLWNWNFSTVVAELHNKFVLIVPLWNWNFGCTYNGTWHVHVLIVPLWNWNAIILLYEKGKDSCSNCTFMELK